MIVVELLSNISIKGFYLNGVVFLVSMKYVFIMDEVDGMVGNEDRGGI